MAAVSTQMAATDERALEIEIVPPAYTRRPVQRLRDPRAIQAVAGSALAIRVRGVSRPEVRVNGIGVEAGADGIARAAAVESGAIAVDAGRQHALVPLTVIPDAAPDVHVTAPGRDLRVADAKASITVHATATDDFGLRALELRYTVVSGAGEQFTFRE